MPGILTPGQVERFRRDGILCPLPALAAEEAAECRQRLESLESASAEAAGILRHKGHLVLTWLADLVRHPAVVDTVADLLGPDLLCWTTNAFIKDPGDGRFVSWHQDATYWGLSSDEVVTAWIALTPSVPANGCMRVVPGSHHRRQLPHTDTRDPANLLTRGQEIQVAVDEADAVDVILAPGQMSLHHVLLVHGSSPNASDDRRIGIAIRYVPTRIRQASGLTDSATLARGEDRFGHFLLESRPRRDLDPDTLEFHRRVSEANAKILHRRI